MDVDQVSFNSEEDEILSVEKQEEIISRLKGKCASTLKYERISVMSFLLIFTFLCTFISIYTNQYTVGIAETLPFLFSFFAVFKMNDNLWVVSVICYILSIFVKILMWNNMEHHTVSVIICFTYLIIVYMQIMSNNFQKELTIGLKTLESHKYKTN